MITDPFENIRKQQEKLQKLVGPFQRFTKIAEQNQRIINITQQFTRINDSINKIKNIIPQPKLINFPAFEQAQRLDRIRENINLFNKMIPEYLVDIASYGWFLDFQTELHLPRTLANYIKNNEIKELDTYLIKYYTDEFEEKINNLSKSHPKRLKIFNELKIAHDNEYFNLGIPLILSQIDGICYDYTKKLFFIKNKKNENNPYLPEVSNELTVISGEFLKAFLSPFLHKTPISAREQDLESFPTAFNRHRILHGKDTDFGTKINFLKAFSLLSYCEDTLAQIHKNIS
jgi:hypothetical protein